MKTLNAIFKSVLFFTVVLLLFSSEKMKGGQTMSIQIEWNSSQIHSFSFEGAIYPQNCNGLPVISIPVESHFDDYEITKIVKREISPSQVELLKGIFPSSTHLLTLNKLKERGNEVSSFSVFPFLFDSTTNTYLQVDYIEIELKKSTKGSLRTNLRLAIDEGSSVLSQGDWYKIPVTKNGVYKIDYDYMKSAGIEVSEINPKIIKIYGNGGGMLPQKNSEERPSDLIENAISIVGVSDGIFNQQDYILFYGQGADHQKFTEEGILEYQKNYYSDTSYYFLTISAADGLRIKERENLGANHPKIQQFDDYIIYEKDEFNIINSGREWYGEKFDFTLTYDFKFDFSDIVPNTNLTVTSAIMGQTYVEASMDLFVNGVSLGQQPVYSIQEGSYLAKGSNQKELFNINTSAMPISDQLTIRMSYNPTGTGKSKASLNYLTVLGKRKLQLYGNQTIFRSIESTQHAISTYEIGNVQSDYHVWDISDPLHPDDQLFSINANSMLFGALNDGLNEYIIFDNQDYLIPESSHKVKNQNLHDSDNLDLIIITAPEFRSEAERLADLRKNHDGLEVLVASTGEIYNEFSSGKQDVTAIRDFIKHIYELGSVDDKLQNVLLFGKGSFDYKNRIENNTNFVPIYTSRNSLHPINSYSSDDYYGFLDEDEGEWNESYSGDHLMDVGIGRLPIKSLEEASAVVDKLINYSTNRETFGRWRNELFFIADDGDGNLHQRDANRLTVLVDTSHTQFNINKIYIDAYEQIESSIGEVAPGVNEEIDRSMEKGGLIFNFTGHGSATRLASETILNISSAIEFENENRLPLFVTATCEFGRHDNPKAISGAEYLLLNPKGGAIGLVTTARPVFSSTNFILNKAFYQNVFKKEDGKYSSLGEVFRRTKNQSLNGSVNRNFSLLGDPSMTLAYAKDDIVLIADEDSYAPGDTLSALGKVRLEGKVLDHNGAVNSGFTGSLFVTVFDQPSEITTYGHEDAPMIFKVRDNVLFKGEVSVKEGAFIIEFVVPKNITFDFEKGKVSLYAMDISQKLDAAGSNIEFVVGGESDDPISDNTPPEIKLFINDTSFVNKGITGPDLLLVAELFDENGISTSNSDIGQELTVMLDDEEEIKVSNYYTSEKDTYKRGWVTYPYKDLSIGTHKIRLKAWDVNNNFNEAEIEFLVVEDENLAIEKLINFPNPFTDFTTFSFEHNRAGDDLEIMIDVFSTQGKLVKQFVYTKENSESRISDIVWDGKEQNGSNLLGGVYIFQLSIRSLIDGSKNQANQKLVIIN